MRYILLAIFIGILVVPAKSQLVSFTQTILFEQNQFEITPAFQDSLYRLKCKTEGRAIEEVFVSGHTDNTGSDADNNQLSNKRAQTIKTWLEDNINGMSTATKFQTAFYGEKNPLNTNANETEKAINRRVTVSIKVNSTPSITIRQLNQYTETPLQEFCINPEKDTLLIARQGTMVYIRAGSFVPTSNNCKCITIQIKEANKLSDILKNNLSTINDSNILFSQSMIFVNAVCDQKTLPLANDKDYIVFSPATENLLGAGLYKGDVDSLGNINWKGIDPASPERINAKDLQKCIGSGRRGDVVVGEGCKKTPYFLKGFFNTIRWTLQSDGAVKKQTYRNCRKIFREQKRAAKKNNNPKNKDLAQISTNPQNKVGCYLPNIGPCGQIVYQFQLDCSINFEKKIKHSIDSILKNGSALNIENINDLQFAVFARKQTGWSNIDWMYKVPEDKKETIRFDLVASPHTNIKIIFSNYKTILQAFPDEDGKLAFTSIPVNEPATLLITDTRTGSKNILAQKLKIITGKNTILPQFTAMSADAYAQLIDSFDK